MDLDFGAKPNIIFLNSAFYTAQTKFLKFTAHCQIKDNFIELNYNEDSSLNYWTFADFNSFAIDVATEGLRRACKLNDLYYDSADEED